MLVEHDNWFSRKLFQLYIEMIGILFFFKEMQWKSLIKTFDADWKLDLILFWKVQRYGKLFYDEIVVIILSVACKYPLTYKNRHSIYFCNLFLLQKRTPWWSWTFILLRRHILALIWQTFLHSKEFYLLMCIQPFFSTFFLICFQTM